MKLNENNIMLYRFELNSKNEISCTECEAVEELNIFRILFGHWETRIFKQNIGKVDPYNGVFLLDKDITMAADIFLESKKADLHIEQISHMHKVAEINKSIEILSKIAGKGVTGNE